MVCLICCLICLILGLFILTDIIQVNNSAKISFIIIIGLILRIVISLDPILHSWDEQFHALVAKNMMNDFFRPMLYSNPLLPYDYKNWPANHIWLHKPPLSLWLISISYRVFGVSEFATRIPSILLSTLIIYFFYYIVKNLFNTRVAILSAFLLAVNGFILEQVGGRTATDHVDSIFTSLFICTVFLSLYIRNKNQVLFSIIIGLMIGLMILTKWLIGLAILTIIIMILYNSQFNFKQILTRVSLILLFCSILVLPWQYFIFRKFPLEASWESQYNFLHFISVIEGHGGSIFYYWNKIRLMVNELVYIPIVWIVIRLLKEKLDWRLILISYWAFVPLIFFSIAKTKMPGYIAFAFPAFFIMMSIFIEFIEKKQINLYIKKIVLFCFMILALRYSFERVKPHKIVEREKWILDLKSLDLNSDSTNVIFNMKEPIKAMFYTDNICYSHLPTTEEMISLSNRKIRLIINANNIDSLQKVKFSHFKQIQLAD